MITMADEGGNTIAQKLDGSNTPRPARRFMSKERAVAFLVMALVVCAGFVYGLRRLEFAITFHPVRNNSTDPPELPRGAESVWFTTVDGVRLHGWFFVGQKVPVLATIIYFHGNGGNITNIGWVGE